jgi:hypothetical protein
MDLYGSPLGRSCHLSGHSGWSHLCIFRLPFKGLSHEMDLACEDMHGQF